MVILSLGHALQVPTSPTYLIPTQAPGFSLALVGISAGDCPIYLILPSPPSYCHFPPAEDFSTHHCKQTPGDHEPKDSRIQGLDEKV